MAGCNETHFDTRAVRIRVVSPDSVLVLPLEGIPVVLRNQTANNAQTVVTDREGQASFTITPGACSVGFSHKVTQDMKEYTLSGGLADLYVELGKEALSLEIPFTLGTVPRLVIEELYFGGCLKPDGKSVYTSDQYLSIANNSADTLYLDGLCIGQAAPFTTASPAGWMQYTDMSEIPLTMMCWQFPGGGTDYPLLPGQRQIVATNAVDHTSGPSGVAASLDLSHADWAFWNPLLTASKISAGVMPLNLVWHTSGTAYGLTVSGPTVLLFLPQSDMAAWAASGEHVRTEPGTTSKLLYLHIPAGWVIDLANFVSQASTTANSRLPFTMDPFPGAAGPTGTGNAWRRVSREEDGRIVWETGNGTLYDFRREIPSLKETSPAKPIKDDQP